MFQIIPVEGSRFVGKNMFGVLDYDDMIVEYYTLDEYYGILKRFPNLEVINYLIDSHNTSYSNKFFDAELIGCNCLLKDKRGHCAYFYIKEDGLRRIKFYCNDKLLGIIPRVEDASFSVFCGNYRNNKVLEFNVSVGKVDNSDIYRSYLIRFERDNMECYVLNNSHAFVVMDDLSVCEGFYSSRFKVCYWTRKNIFLQNN